MTPQKVHRPKAKLYSVENKTLKEAESTRHTTNPQDFSMSILTEGEFMSIQVPEREHVIHNLIVEETITIVNGFRGSGKSWFMMAIGNEVSWKGEIGPWKVGKGMNVLLIDGEMPMSLLQQRLKMMNVGRDVKNKPYELFIYPESYAYRIGLHRANILDKKWRQSVTSIIKQLNVGMLVLDNLSSLAPGIDENDKMAFDEVNRWMLELRFNGVTIVMTHHTGKSGEQRGTSAHEDHVDTAIVLSRPQGWTSDTGCMFTVGANKDREYIMQGEKRTIKLEEIEERQQFVEVGTKGGEKRAKARMFNNVKAAKEEGISERTFYRAKRGK